MSNAKHVMVDLETMGTDSKSAVVSIGAVKFTSKIVDEFYINIDLKSSAAKGMFIDPGTIIWWMKQSDEARKALRANTTEVDRALMQFSLWFGESKYIWGNGSAFDCVILGNAFRACEIPVPWNFYDERCYRTLKSLFPQLKAADTRGTKHNALEDARYQAEHLIKIIRHKREKLGS